MVSQAVVTGVTQTMHAILLLEHSGDACKISALQATFEMVMRCDCQTPRCIS